MAVLLAAILLRGAVIVSDSASLQDDPDSYTRLAVNWTESGAYGFVQSDGSVRKTAFRPPLYPWLLSWFVVDDPPQPGTIPWAGVAALHFFLSAVSIGLVYSIAKTLAIPHAWLPAAAWACDPLLLRASQLVMTETLAACLALIAWQCWLWLTGRLVGVGPSWINSTAGRLSAAGALGISFGLAILARPTAAPWAALCVAGLVATWTSQRAGRWAVAALVTLGILSCVLPWTIRNFHVFGKPIWATTHGGYTLLLANNPRLYDHFRRTGPSRGWDAEPFHQAWAARGLEGAASEYQPTQEEYWFADYPLATSASADGGPPFDEIEDDELAYASAKACISRSPGMLVTSTVYRVGWFWALWPYVTAFSWTAAAIGGWYGIWFLLAIRGICSTSVRSEYRSWLPGLLLVISLTAVHGIYWSNMRMRGPLMSVVYLVATAQFSTRQSAPSKSRTPQ